jgi:hypothetical protein
MPDRSDVTPDILRQLIDYDPASGELTWLPRGPEWFFGEEQSPEHSAKIWNRVNADKPALSHKGEHGYRYGAVFGHQFRSHRVAWAIHHGEWPVHEIDHIDGDRANNCIANLRDVPGSVNSKNLSRRRTNTSGVTGVSWFARTNKWVAMIKGDGKVRNLGYFHTIEEAAAARKAAEKRYGFHENHGRAA